MSRLPGLVRSRLADRQFRSGLHLISSSAYNAAAGLAFWFVAARGFDESVIGLNAALISAMVLVANLSTLGMKNTIIRYLPVYGDRAGSLVARTYGVTGLTTIVVAPIAALVLVARIDELELLGSPGGVVFFTAACLVWIVFVLQDSVLVGLDKTRLIPLTNLAYAFAKLLVLLTLVVSAPRWGVFIAWSLAVLPVVGWVSIVIARATGGRQAREHVHEAGLVRFAAGEHASTMLNLALAGLMPLYVLDQLGDEASAFYAMAWTIAYNLMLTNSNVSTALLAEAAQDRDRLAIQAGKAMKQMLLFVVPGTVAVVALAPIGLRAFGASYAAEGTTVLRLLALAGLANVPVAVAIGMLRARRQVSRLFGLYVARTLLIGGLAVLLIGRYGLSGAGWAWLIGESTLATALLAVPLRSISIAAAPRVVIQASSRLKSRFRLARAARTSRPVIAELYPNATNRRLLSASADVSVVHVERSLGPPLVVKIASSRTAEAQLRFEASRLRDLGSRAELGVWRKMLATVEDEGETHGSRWVAQSMIAGRPMSALIQQDGDIAALTAAAMESIAPLHAATAHLVAVDEALLEHLVRQPVATITAWRPELRASLDNIADDLCVSLDAGPLTVGAIHGDFAPGNILCDATPHNVNGIVDWELSADDKPPELDLIQFSIATLTESAGMEWGALVREVLAAAAEPTAGISPVLAATAAGPNGFDVATGVTLTWIHHVASNLDKSTGFRRNTIWFDRNVDSVVESLQASERAHVTH